MIWQITLIHHKSYSEAGHRLPLESDLAFNQNNNAVVPLVSKSPETRKLFFVNTGCKYEFRLDSPDFGFQNLTYREVLHRFGSGYNCGNRSIRLIVSMPLLVV